MENKSQKKIIVIGAGIIGLNLSYYLAKLGYKVVLIEKDERLGGLCSWIDLGGVCIDRFYHVFSGRDRNFLEMVDEVGAFGSIKPARPSLGFFFRGKTYPMQSINNLVNFPLLSARDKISLATVFLKSRLIKDWKKIEGLNVSKWMVSMGAEGAYNKVLSPMMRLRFGDCFNEVNATAMWYRINRMSTLRNVMFKEESLCFEPSMKVLIDGIERCLLERGAFLIKGEKVLRVENSGENCTGVTTEEGKFIGADAVVCTAPIPELLNILPVSLRDFSLSLKKISYISNSCLILKLSRPLSAYYMLALVDETFPFTGIIGFSNLRKSQFFPDSHLFYITRYFCGEDSQVSKQKSVFLGEYIPYIKKICPQFEEGWIRDYALTNSPYVEPLHILGYSKVMPGIKTPLKNLYIANNAQVYPNNTVVDTSIKFAKDIAKSLAGQI